MSETDLTPGEVSSIDPDAPEFDDYAGPLLPEGFGFDLRRLFSPESLRGLAAVVVAILVLRAPRRSPRGFAVLVGLILIAWAVGGLVELRKPSERTTWSFVRIAFLTVTGSSFLLIEEFTGDALGRISGAILVVGGITIGARAWWYSEPGSRSDQVVGALLYTALGVALLVAPLPILGLAVLSLSIFWFLAGLLAIVTNIRLDDRQIAATDTWRIFLEWIQTRPNTADDRQQLYQGIFYEGGEQVRRLSRFFVLMGLATAIAAWGIVADSTAVVIGAMLVAPLMTPLMGTSLAITMGWPRRALMSGTVALVGIALAIALGILFGWVYGPAIAPSANSQIASRIAPTLVDLIIAVAAGGAGAFALSRPDVSDALPGVAVAIALVPPLAVVGLMISHGNYGAASGAMLLFLTNLVAILLVGGLVFILTGVVPVLRMAERAHWLKRTLGMVVVLAIAVIASLSISAETFQRQTAGLQKAQNVVDSWLSGSNLQVSSASYVDGEYQIVLTGSDRPPPIDELADAMADKLGTQIPLRVTLVPTETFTFQP